jgi:hypothetical protein
MSRKYSITTNKSDGLEIVDIFEGLVQWTESPDLRL